MGCGAQSPGVLYYQWGDASINPASELADPAGSIARAAAIVNSSGCHQMGLIPEGHFFSSQSCAVDSTGGLYQKIDWSTIGLLDVTGNWLLTDACAGKGTVQDYVSFVRSIVAYVRQRNPRIVITAHLSFGNLSPATMVQAVQELGGLVDGFLIAYPLSPMHEHLYSTAPNLELLLSSLRPR
jgi:hypothetical protein